MSPGNRRRRGRRFLLYLLLAAGIVAASAWATVQLLSRGFGRGIGTAETAVPWNLTLVNGQNPVPSDWSPALTELRYGQRVDSRIYPSLQRMFDACRAAGLTPYVASGYRTEAEQEAIVQERIAALTATGLSADEARTQALRAAAPTGYSEHQLGLAVDVDSEDPAACPDQAVWDWLGQHCAEYGFILRYPRGQEDATGYDYEPWHFRYVGEEAARAITDGGLTLEAYAARNEAASGSSFPRLPFKLDLKLPFKLPFQRPGRQLPAAHPAGRLLPGEAEAQAVEAVLADVFAA